jgi:hypothetical protein
MWRRHVQSRRRCGRRLSEPRNSAPRSPCAAGDDGGGATNARRSVHGGARAGGGGGAGRACVPRDALAGEQSPQRCPHTTRPPLAAACLRSHPRVSSPGGLLPSGRVARMLVSAGAFGRLQRSAQRSIRSVHPNGAAVQYVPDGDEDAVLMLGFGLQWSSGGEWARLVQRMSQHVAPCCSASYAVAACCTVGQARATYPARERRRDRDGRGG